MDDMSSLIVAPVLPADLHRSLLVFTSFSAPKTPSNESFLLMLFGLLLFIFNSFAVQFSNVTESDFPWRRRKGRAAGFLLKCFSAQMRTKNPPVSVVYFVFVSAALSKFGSTLVEFTPHTCAPHPHSAHPRPSFVMGQIWANFSCAVPSFSLGGSKSLTVSMTSVHWIFREGRLSSWSKLKQGVMRAEP